MGTFIYEGDKFYKNGKEHCVYSGAIHYFRVLPNSWRDRLLKLKAVGFNAVETYICWSLHEREEGKFDFSGRLDFGKFIDEAKDLGLDVIVRPGPYVCAETDLGGLPSWLLNYPDMELRCDNEIFLEKADNYFKAVSEIIRPRLIGNGGNILMLQVENEYGSYGNDPEYKKKLVEIYRKHGLDCLLFTADGNERDMLESGKIDGIFQALTFGSKPRENFEANLTDKNQPRFCAEYWNGWFDCYGEPHHTRGAESVADETRQFIESGSSFNFYMFVGGTNFEMMNGANYRDGKYCYQTTSYDYDSLLTEAGDITPKYLSVKEVMEELTGVKSDIVVENSKKVAYKPVYATGFSDLLDNLGESQRSVYPLTLEKLGVDFGYALYTTKLKIFSDSDLRLRGLKDRATVMIDGEIVGTVDKQTANNKIPLKKTDREVELQILVENRGRCNYGYNLKDPKGILGGAVFFYSRRLMDFKNYPVKAKLPDNVIYNDVEKGQSKKIGFYKFELDVGETPCDTFVYPEGFRNGCIYVNGFNLGRFCLVEPPQLTYYLPAELLKPGKNEIVVFETDGTDNPKISFFDHHIFGEASEYFKNKK